MAPPSAQAFSCYSMNGSCCSSDKKPGEGDGAANLDIPVYSSSEVIEKLRGKLKSEKKQTYRAMYSSVFGGITLDPASMVIPIDDHMVHRGHGVFDTTMLMNGYLYDLDSHLDRFLLSASKAKISSPFARRTLRSILIQLAAASKCRTGSIRYWLSAGPGDFQLSPAGCPEPAFYAVVVSKGFSTCEEAVKVITSTVPMKPPMFATMKNVNYLPNVFSKMEAEEKGAFASIWVDDRGCIAEGPNANLAFISKSKELLLPSSDKILVGCTANRVFGLAAKLVEKGLLKSVESRDITFKEAKNSAEMMFVSSLLPILPIIAWDDQPIGEGRVGDLTLAISDLLWEDITAGPATRRGAVSDILENTTNDFFDKTINILRQTAESCYDKIKEIGCITCPHKPEGSMFVMAELNLSYLEDINDDVDFCCKLAKEESVIILPGRAVGLKNWLRITFAIEPSSLEDGLGRLKSFCERHAKQNK